MSYKQGETNWYDKFSEEQKEHEHRKPWVPNGGALLAEAEQVAQKGAERIVIGQGSHQWLLPAGLCGDRSA